MMKFSSNPERYHREKIYKGFVIAPVLLMVLLATSKVLAETKIEMEETEITGARELPKVLYIVPWKKTRPGGDPLPMRSLIDEALSPIDVDVFKRQVRYYDMTQPQDGAKR